MRFILPILLTLTACNTTVPTLDNPQSYMGVAHQYLGYEEQANRRELKAFMGVDPVRFEWCAAFANAALRESGYVGTEVVSDNPLLARSFLHYGEEVTTPIRSDIVVLRRGNQSWQGHVGFYVGQKKINGTLHYALLSGNNEETVDIDWYDANRVLGIRRPTSASLLRHRVRSLLVKIQDDQQSLLLARYDQSQRNLLAP